MVALVAVSGLVGLVLLIFSGWFGRSQKVGRAMTFLIVGILLFVVSNLFTYEIGLSYGHDLWIGLPYGQSTLEPGSTHEVIASEKLKDNFLVIIKGPGKIVRVCSMYEPLPPECTKVRVLRHKTGFNYLEPVTQK